MPRAVDENVHICGDQGWNIVPILKEALASLPEGVEQVYMRQDTAAYQTEVMAGVSGSGNIPNTAVSSLPSPPMLPLRCGMRSVK